METDLNAIHIFKTNIEEIIPNSALQNLLNSHAEIQQWSIDCEDIDRVLRVVSETLKPETIINLINENGHSCQELS